MSEIYVLIGAGQAAAQGAASLRQEGFTGRILMIGEEPAAPYHRPPLSKKFLLGELDAHRLLLKPAEFYSKFAVDLRLSTRVSRIVRDNKRVHLTGGDVVAYDKLLLATGSRPRQLSVPGADQKRVHYLRTLADVDALRPVLRPGATLVVIGGGYIGLEVAAVALTLGVHVELVEAASRLLARVAGPVISEFFLHTHTSRGVKIHLHAGVTGLVDQSGRGVGVALSNGDVLSADAVLVGIGAMPNTELAEEAGIAVNNGIVVNDVAQTSAPDVFAAGDCTRHPNPLYGSQLRLESVPNAIEQAKTAAAAMCGKAKPYHQVPWFWSDQFEFKFQAAGLIGGADRYVVAGDPTASPLSVTYYRDDKPIAIEAVNAPAEFMAARSEIGRSFQYSAANGARAPAAQTAQ